MKLIFQYVETTLLLHLEKYQFELSVTMLDVKKL